ncbi:MAG TPA: MucR family transcriptional regulator [Alphaproteobacteria bacterium]|nr:MucR family transcriptional regulator [Alphaproteobacteria bacterium]HAJ48557.1 MucR family transcriptional regulator [Alphaproteobacteria bacterium]
MLVTLTAQIVSSFVTRNLVPASEVAELTKSVHAALAGLANGVSVPQNGELRPAVPIKKSYTDDWIICLEDGKKFKSLKRHLKSAFDLTPEQYREKWGLPPDYPMVAPNYSERRSALAKQIGLGQVLKTSSRKGRGSREKDK